MPNIVFKHADKRYDERIERYVFRDLNLHIRRGEFTAIMGPSGSGKSTLMHCLAGLDRITSGQVFLAGMEISNLPDAKLTTLRRDNVGFIFQSFNLVAKMSAQALNLVGYRSQKT